MQRLAWDELSYDELRGVYLNREKLFTGVVFQLGEDARLEGEQTFVKGLPHGEARIYGPSGQLTEQCFWRGGVYHGLRKTWYSSGVLASQEVFEWGVCLSRQKWNQAEVLEESHLLTPQDPLYPTVEFNRRLYGALEDSSDLSRRMDSDDD